MTSTLNWSRARASVLLASALLLLAPSVQAESPTRANELPAKADSRSAALAAMLEAGKYEEGLKLLGSPGKAGAQAAQEDRFHGLFHHGLGQADAALKYLLPLYRVQHGDDVVILALAEASLWKKDYKTAASVLSALKAPDAPEALRVRGMLLEQAGRLTEALALYDRAIPQLKLPWGTLERKAQVLSWLKRFDESAAVYNKVIHSTQASGELRRRCRVRLAELSAWNKDFAGALAQLAKLLQDAPRSVDALLLRGQILEWQGEFAQAKRTYSRVLELDASQAEARLRLSKLLWVE